jgi:DNA-binding HxlR family transcriptional regulator
MSLSLPTRHKGACPVAKTAQLIGDVWALLIVKELLTGPKRFSELEKAINCTEPVGEISSRTLSSRLKMLEKNKILKRKLIKNTPGHAEYTLTSRGEDLSEIIEKIREYGKKHS